MIKESMRGAIAWLGLKKRRKASRSLGYDLEADAMALIPAIRAFTMIPVPRLITLHQQVRYCDSLGIPGAFVECGVWKGGSVGLMALTNLRHASSRRDLHLFDAFTEICEPDERVDGARAVQEVRAWTKDKGGTRGRLKALTGIYDALEDPEPWRETARCSRLPSATIATGSTTTRAGFKTRSRKMPPRSAPSPS